MINVQVYGSEPPCAKCKHAEEVARKAAEPFPGQVSVEKLSALGPEGQGLGIMTTPTVVVNGTIVAQGKVPKESELQSLYRLELGRS